MSKVTTTDQGEITYARRRVVYARTVSFTGRNGHFKCAGLEIVRSPSARTFIFEPITSKGQIGHCSIEIPIELADEVTEALTEMRGGDGAQGG